MKITISYESKWSASFADYETKDVKAGSLKALGEKRESGAINPTIDPEDSYEDIMRKVNTVYPNFDYQTITKNTVLGVLARLLGEVRYMNVALKDENHIINSLSEKVSFVISKREMYNEVITMSTPIKDTGGGSGLMDVSSDARSFENIWSKILYIGFNAKNIKDLSGFLLSIENQLDVDKIELLINSNNLNFGEDFIYKIIEGFDKFGKNFYDLNQEYTTYQQKGVITKNINEYIEILKLIGKINHNDEEIYLDKKIVLGGLIMQSVFNCLKKVNGYEITNSNLFKFDSKTQTENISGVSSINAKTTGSFTKKDFYKVIAEKATSSSSPYFFDMYYIDKNKSKRKIKLGLGKEDGLLEIFIDIPKDKAILIKEQIENSAVSVFQMGKKGLAYVKRIEL